MTGVEEEVSLHYLGFVVFLLQSMMQKEKKTKQAKQDQHTHTHQKKEETIFSVT